MIKKVKRKYYVRNTLIRGCLTFIFSFFISTPLFSAYYWSSPRYITRNTDKLSKSDVISVDVDGRVLVFFIEEGKRSANINYLLTEDFRTFSNPLTAKRGIELKEGFSPHFDAFYMNNRLHLVWNTLDGLLRFMTSSDKGNTWEGEKILIRDENFCFRPELFYENGHLYLFYHTESEGRRIDFFSIRSRDNGRTWSEPSQIARGFAGSFFPYMSSHRGAIYVVWQSRPFVEARAPVFNVYLAISRDGGNTWSEPMMLIDETLGENTRPLISLQDDRLCLIYEGDRLGATGIFYSEFDLSGRRLSEERKVNEFLSNAKAPGILVVDDNLIVFYIDGRDGNERIYYALMGEDRFIENGPLGVKGKDILQYFPIAKGSRPYLFWMDKEGLALIGPDTSVPSIKIVPPKSRFMGVKGVVVEWKDVIDSSGLEGFCYSFNREESYEPEIVNLSPWLKRIHLKSREEGDYYFHLKAKDKAGNYSKTVSVPFIVDITPPPPPAIIPLPLSEDGFYEDNSVVVEWSIKSSDVAGYNYSLSKRKITIGNPRIRTTKRKAMFETIGEGTWYFNVAAVDRAGNIGKTTRYAVRMKPLPEALEKDKKIIKISPPWILKSETFQVNPALNIALYVVLGGLLFITFFVSSDIILKIFAGGERVQMDEKVKSTGIRKKRFGLRFKFSLLIVALILILTIGISGILSYVSTEYQKKALADQMIDKAKLSLENMTNVAREGILNNDELLLLSVISKAMENEEIRYSIILDTNNRVVAHSDINERGKVLSDSITQMTSRSNEIVINPEYDPDKLEEMYILASPVKFADTRLGTVQIGYSTESIFQTINEARRNNLYSAVIVTVGTILVGIIGAVLMASITIRPIKVLAKGANIIGEGRLDYKIHIKARDEIGLLSDEFNRMTERLLEYQNKMEEKAKMDEQLEIARNIQQDLIPQIGIENEFISIDGFYKAAAGVGGDYYDFIQIDNDKYGVIMSDVAGKGVPASLMMIMIRTVFKSLVHSGVSEPSRVVTLMNETLASDISSDRFATLLFGVYNQKKRYFRYTNAGYGPLMVYKREKNSCFLVQPPKGSVPIGVMPDLEFSEEKPIALDVGDTIVLFTDGIHEARNEAEEEYGMKRLANIIPSFAKRNSKEIANLIIEDVTGFVGNAEQYDDMTLTVMKVK